MDELLDTPFGRASLIKIVLVVVLLALGAVNRRRTLPALGARPPTGAPPAARPLLRRTLRAELALGVAALAVTGALASYAPVDRASPARTAATANVGPARVEVTVDPARAGPNEVHLYLFDRASGAPVGRDQELPSHRRAAAQGDRPDRARAAQGRPRPLRERGAPLGARGRLEARGRRARLGVRGAAGRFVVPVR